MEIKIRVIATSLRSLTRMRGASACGGRAIRDQKKVFL